MVACTSRPAWPPKVKAQLQDQWNPEFLMQNHNFQVADLYTWKNWICLRFQNIFCAPKAYGLMTLRAFGISSMLYFPSMLSVIAEDWSLSMNTPSPDRSPLCYQMIVVIDIIVNTPRCINILLQGGMDDGISMKRFDWILNTTSIWILPYMSLWWSGCYPQKGKRALHRLLVYPLAVEFLVTLICLLKRWFITNFCANDQ